MKLTVGVCLRIRTELEICFSFPVEVSSLTVTSFQLSEPSKFQMKEDDFDALRLPFLSNGNANEPVKQPVAVRNPDAKKNYNKVCQPQFALKLLHA